MVEIIGFLMVFSVLALIIGTLAEGVVRWLGFAVLVALAIIVGKPIMDGLPTLSFFNGQDSAQIQPDATVQQAPANVPSSSADLPSNAPPSNRSASPYNSPYSTTYASPYTNRPSTSPYYTNRPSTSPYSSSPYSTTRPYTRPYTNRRPVTAMW